MGFFREMPKYKKEVEVSLLIFLGLFLFSFRVNIIGSSLLDMEIRVQKDFATTSRLITSHSGGYFLGAIIVTLLDKYLNDFVAMGLGTSASGIAVVIIPMLYNYYGTLFFSFLNGIGNSIYDLKCHIVLAKLWGPEKVGNSIQILHMFFGFGCLLCPAFVRLFLLPIPDEAMEDYETYIKMYTPGDVQLAIPFFSVGIPSFFLGFCFLYYFYNNPYSEENHEVLGHESRSKSIKDDHPENISKKSLNHPGWKKCLAVLWVAASAHIGFAIASMIGSYIQAFGVKSSLHMKKETAALIAAVFWASYIAARALFVGLTIFLPERLVVNICHLMMVASIVLLCGFITIHPICLWLTAIFLGAGHSPIFPACYALIGRYFPLTGQHTSLIFVVGITGDSLNTAISGTLMDENPMYYAYHIGVISVLCIFLSFTLPIACRKMFGEKVQESIDVETRKRSRIGSIMMPPPPRANSTTLSIH